MVDTIVLTLSMNMCYISEPDRFQPSARLILSGASNMGSRGYIQCKQNPSKTELRNGIYKPRLTLTNRINRTDKCEPSLKIEFSIPKLLYGNNFDEFIQSDFDQMVEKLRKTLESMGVRVFTLNLKNAPVSAIHYSKNIPLTDGMTSHYLINRIAEANIDLALDVNQTDYRNNGFSYKWHANSYEVAFYDKVKDIKNAKISEKRAIEKDNGVQLNLFNNMGDTMQPEVLRMEVRLNKRQKLGHMLRLLGIRPEMSFVSLVNQDVAQRILLHYLDELEHGRTALCDYQPSSPIAMLSDLLIQNPCLGPRKILQVFGLKILLEKINIRELRPMFRKINNRSWYRLVDDMNKVVLPRNIGVSPLVTIRKHLMTFKSLRTVDFHEEMINNDKQI